MYVLVICIEMQMVLGFFPGTRLVAMQPRNEVTLGRLPVRSADHISSHDQNSAVPYHPYFTHFHF
jgi:hypothetical protein